MSRAPRPSRRRTPWTSLTLAALAVGLVAIPAFAADHDVAVGDNFYDPDEITIADGDTVNWTYAGNVTHDVVLENGEFDSRDFATTGLPDTISYTFEESGTYLYYCTYHAACEDGECFGEMWGTVQVEGAAQEPSESETSEPEPTETETAEPEATETEVPAADATEESSPSNGTAASETETGPTDDMPDTGSTPVVAALTLVGLATLLFRRRTTSA